MDAKHKHIWLRSCLLTNLDEILQLIYRDMPRQPKGETKVVWQLLKLKSSYFLEF